MRNRIIAMVCVGMMVLAGSAFAGEAGKAGLGLKIGYSGYAGDTFTENGVSVDFDPAAAAFFGVNLTYFFADDWCVEGAVEYCKSQVDAKVGNVKVDVGDMTQIPILLTLRYQPTVGQWMPYIGGGVGYYINDFDDAVVVTPETDLEDNFGFLVNCGADFMVNANNAIGLDLRYTWNDTKDENTKNSPSLELNAFQAALGWKYLF